MVSPQGATIRVHNHHTAEQLRLLLHQADRPAMVLKTRAVTLAEEGSTAAAIGKAVGVGTRTVQDWIRRYNNGGLPSPKDQRSSNHRHLTEEQEQELRDQL